jgi:2-amino-4-hydroxy-6-hydroxymethyldihydropteridine diphosphokinase
LINVVPQASRYEIAHIGLGSNLDDPVRHVRQALQELGRLPRTHVVACSSLYRTVPVGKLDQPDFVNAVAVLDTELSPLELLRELRALEARHGRLRGEPNGPRTLDLDVLLLGNRVIREPGLEVPHARMHERAFVLLPLAEVSPEAVVPGRGSVTQLAARFADQGVTRIDG